MAQLHLTCFIAAAPELVHRLCRSVDLQTKALQQFEQKPIAGLTTGILQAQDWVVWQAKHFGKTFQMKVQVTKMEAPLYFCGSMVDGPFKTLTHHHYCKWVQNGTILIDKVEAELPLGWMGKQILQLGVIPRLKLLIEQRNQYIKQLAAAEHWNALPGMN